MRERKRERESLRVETEAAAAAADLIAAKQTTDDGRWPPDGWPMLDWAR